MWINYSASNFLAPVRVETDGVKSDALFSRSIRAPATQVAPKSEVLRHANRRRGQHPDAASRNKHYAKTPAVERPRESWPSHKLIKISFLPS